jgi:ketosteroid isomerase-like protein
VSNKDIEVVRDQFDAVNERDFERAMDLYAEDVVLVVPPAETAPEPGTYAGKESVGRWFGNWFQSFDRDYSFEIDEARMIGDQVFIHAWHGGRGRTSGIAVRGELSYLYRVRDGKVSRVEIYPTREEALAAVRPQAGSRGEVD